MLYRALAPVKLNGVTHLAFDIASNRDALFNVILEEHSTHYVTQVRVKGCGKSAHQEIPLSAFKRDSAEVDTKERLEHAKLEFIAMEDVTDFNSRQNTIYVGNIEWMKKTVPISSVLAFEASKQCDTSN